MKLINKYVNGNVTISLFDNGTKVYEYPDDVAPNMELPASLDIKLTDKCNLNCKFCHESSTINGEHANLDRLLNILKQLPKSTECAFGGGNIFELPNLEDFLYICTRELELIPSITVNGKHLRQYSNFINYLIEHKLVYGVGISISDDFDFKDIDLINNTSNCVYHIIVGLHKISNDRIEILDKIANSPINKALILGYKSKGRGVLNDSNTGQLCKSIAKFTTALRNHIRQQNLSFDNLAIKQLNIEEYLTEKEWDEFYMGDDGIFTMYIDAVKEQFASSSTSDKCYDISYYNNMKAMFTAVKHESMSYLDVQVSNCDGIWEIIKVKDSDAVNRWGDGEKTYYCWELDKFLTEDEVKECIDDDLDDEDEDYRNSIRFNRNNRDDNYYYYLGGTVDLADFDDCIIFKQNNEYFYKVNNY